MSSSYHDYFTLSGPYSTDSASEVDKRFMLVPLNDFWLPQMMKVVDFPLAKNLFYSIFSSFFLQK